MSVPLTVTSRCPTALLTALLTAAARVAGLSWGRCSTRPLEDESAHIVTTLDKDAHMLNPLGRMLKNRRAGQETLAWAVPGLEAEETLTLRSEAFSDGGLIPREYRGRILGENVSPALEWDQPPAGTVELAFLVEDPDVPHAGRAGVHLAVSGIDPERRGFAKRALMVGVPAIGKRFGKASVGRLGWVGPMPVPGHGPHAYVFQLFALDTALGLSQGFCRDELVAAMEGHVLGRAKLTGLYEIR